jgi:dUTP pyrophosphatase
MLSLDIQQKNKGGTYSFGIEVNGDERVQYLEPSEGQDKFRNRIYISKAKTMEDILKEVDSFCTKYYKASEHGVSADMIDVFKDFNKVYHALRNLTKSDGRKIRGFEKIEKYGDVNIPKRGTNKSAGYDIESIEDVDIEPGTTKVVLTGLKAYMMDDEVLKLYIRSSLAIKKGLTLANNVGIIDADYYNNLSNEGHIMVALTNLSDSTVTIKKGDMK